jgi:DNA-binding NarL/FixJ family response regulator
MSHAASLATVRVLIADDHSVVREGIRHVLGADSGFEVIGEAADGREALSLAISLEPDVIVLDLSMPVLSGLEAAVAIREAVPDARILVLSIHDHDEYVLQSVRAGAHGYLRKDSSPAELRAAVRAVHSGASVFSPEVARALSAPGRVSGETTDAAVRLTSLTTREREVLIEVASGATNKQIAARLGISVRTVESHREAVMRKLGIHGVAALTRFALDAGLRLRSTTES